MDLENNQKTINKMALPISDYLKYKWIKLSNQKT